LRVGSKIELDDAAPWLHSHYEASTLIRAAPPLCSASVLSSLWDHHLEFSLHIGATGSHVPHRSLNHVHAALTPGATQAISRLLLGSSWATTTPSFDAIPTLSTLHRTVRFRSSPWPSPDTSCAPFPRTLPTATLDRHDSGAVWSLLLQAGSEGPTLISCAARRFQLAITTSLRRRRGAQSSAYRTRVACPRS